MSLFIIMEFSLCQEPVFSTIVSYLMTRAASYACLYRAPTPPTCPPQGKRPTANACYVHACELVRGPRHQVAGREVRSQPHLCRKES